MSAALFGLSLPLAFGPELFDAPRWVELLGLWLMGFSGGMAAHRLVGGPEHG